MLDVIRHLLENYDYYDRGDCRVSEKKREIESLLAAVNMESSKTNDEEFTEGNEHLRLHRYRERNSSAARKKKEEALAAGHLVCEGCNIDYLKLFHRDEAMLIVECHHTIPICSIKFNGTTKKSTLVLLCANCHRLAHSKNPILSIKKVIEIRKRANKLLESVDA